ncbi:chorismate synthase [Candidatus Aerophobetes bacterium]|uniref:Chorismate synthase n=1 Tax=Aerophobetes bacterium TaxID=2030807 RepID=A0A2A4YG37_UNCAE|nr:MAG: chorismate synthase [Candidatus Aerophobetes bacterium]
MAQNSFGDIFRITTFGESHGKALGVIIDGCPAGLEITEEDINNELFLRQPGKTEFTTPRKEKDAGKILSGTFEGKTTGAPICIVIYNHDADSSKYEAIKDVYRPGHANFTYLEKYGIFDYRGGGRSSARETACRVAAGAVAKKFLASANIHLCAYIKEIGGIEANVKPDTDTLSFREKVYDNPIFCPDKDSAAKMMDLIKLAKEEGDSLGGVVELISSDLPTGLGDPVYGKLEAKLAFAMMSLPATKGVEFGSGFSGSKMRGSEHNDHFILDDKKNVRTKTNFSGGTLGGISNGMPLKLRVAFKPTSSITKPIPTLTVDKKETTFNLPEGSRHDPCVTIRAVPIVESMASIVLADCLLLNRCARTY